MLVKQGGVQGAISGIWAWGSRHYTRHAELDATLEAMLCCWDSNISKLVH
jgi:hypothetical protein